MSEKISTLISKEAIDKRVNELAAEISADYAGKCVFVACVLKGAFIFAADLIRQLTVDVEVDFIDVSSYGKGMKSSQNMTLVLDLQEPVQDRDVLLVEDIADTGRSIQFIKKQLEGRGAASLRLCTLLDKPDARVLPEVTPDYVGFVIPDKFVVGYGLDFGQKYRNLPYIGFMSFED